MKKLFYSMCCSLPLLFLCCATTPISETPIISDYQMQTTSPGYVQMEFIGYKADTSLLSTTPETITKGQRTYTIMSPYDQWKAISETSSLRRIGKILQAKNIANDQSYAYFGIYSLQELELYKSRTRYITFIEVVKNKYTVSDNSLNKNLYGTFGATFLATGIVGHVIAVALPDKEIENGIEYDYTGYKSTLNITGLICDVAGIGCLIAGGTKAKSEVTFDGTYNIYVYDTYTKEVIFKDAVTVSSTDTFTGSYLQHKESQAAVNDYYAKLICNEILKKYDSINQWLKQR